MLRFKFCTTHQKPVLNYPSTDTTKGNKSIIEDEIHFLTGSLLKRVIGRYSTAQDDKWHRDYDSRFFSSNDLPNCHSLIESIFYHEIVEKYVRKLTILNRTTRRQYHFLYSVIANQQNLSITLMLLHANCIYSNWQLFIHFCPLSFHRERIGNMWIWQKNSTDADLLLWIHPKCSGTEQTWIQKKWNSTHISMVISSSQ